MSNVSSGLKIYCGMKALKPHQKRGTTLQCFKRGVGIGIGIQTEKNKKKLNEVESIIRAETIKANVRDIESKGLLPFKQMLRLNSLSKDLIRSIAVKLTGSRDEIRGYSNMSREQLISALVERGWQR